MKNIILYSLLFSVPFFNGCSSNNDDLQEWMRQESSNMKGKVQPIPPITPYIAESYIGRDLPDPFSPKKNLAVPAANAPDLKRKKEFLESFPLEQLTMNGTMIVKNEIIAMIKTPEGTIHKVRKGNYIGLNYGKIVEITSTDIKISETILDSSGGWSERFSKIETAIGAAISTANLNNPQTNGNNGLFAPKSLPPIPPIKP